MTLHVPKTLRNKVGFMVESMQHFATALSKTRDGVVEDWCKHDPYLVFAVLALCHPYIKGR